jgi:hypothetical protein
LYEEYAESKTRRQIKMSALPLSIASQRGGLINTKVINNFSVKLVLPRKFVVKKRISAPTRMMIVGASAAGIRNKSIK